ncbi:MAG TPA: hypothetical protein VHX62_02005 [Solirubrobacteraceae bacterium]|nr:hypothetical protein [Solirubrobacteraceae bacterium]
MNRPAWPRRAGARALALIAAGAVTAAVAATAAAATATTAATTASGPPAAATIAAPTFHSRVFASGSGIAHRTRGGIEPISQPDDISYLAGHIFVGFQNGVGPQGQASTSGNRDSTVVEFDLRGHRVAQWDVAGKCDGVTADVPAFAGRFAGQFMLTSQGDEEQIFVAAAGTAHQSLSVLKLTASVDDTAWPTGPAGSLYTTDNSHNTIERITGPFTRGSEVAATTPCDENSAPSTCPGPGFPPNYLGRVNPNTGLISRVAVTGAPLAPQGMLFLRSFSIEMVR